MADVKRGLLKGATATWYTSNLDLDAASKLLVEAVVWNAALKDVETTSTPVDIYPEEVTEKAAAFFDVKDICDREYTVAALRSLLSRKGT